MGGPRPKTEPPSAAPEFDEPDLARHWVKLLLDAGVARLNFFPGGLFADPAWDMLLDLTHARLTGKRVSVSSLCIASHIPATTALRRIADLAAAGLVLRIKDDDDGRRVFIELTEDGYVRMANYLMRLRLAITASPDEYRRRF